MIKNIIPSYWKLLLDFFGIKPMSEMAKKRLSVCREYCNAKNLCPKRDCPCPLMALAQEESESCPLDLWYHNKNKWQ